MAKRRSWHGKRQRNRIIRALVKRDGLENCCLCNRSMSLAKKYPDPLRVTIEHKVPLSVGGSNELWNLGLAHAICNEREGRIFEDKRRESG